MIALSGYDETVIPIAFTGLRKGEKLNEELSYKFEKSLSTGFDKLRMLSDGEPVYTEDQADSMIAEFSTAAATFSKENIRDTIKKYLPEFGSV
jgi:FlaA1/EpsC-like NDP-sugar epimerase